MRGGRSFIAGGADFVRDFLQQVSAAERPKIFNRDDRARRQVEIAANRQAHFIFVLIFLAQFIRRQMFSFRLRIHPPINFQSLAVSLGRVFDAGTVKFFVFAVILSLSMTKVRGFRETCASV